MGAWGHHAFENDDALDWLGCLEDGDWSAVATTLRKLPAASEFMEAPECGEIIAAAEVIAAGNGDSTAMLPEEVEDFVARCGRPPASLATEARQALDRISANSELRDLWAETDDFQAWLDQIENLKRRLQIQDHQ